MNHSYFASLLENYRRRMDMDPSVLSIRKALYNSYNNESFKLKERQRHAMAKQRREEMEANRVFRNKIKEMKEKEKEISMRYAHLRMRPAENEMAKWKADKMKDLNYTQQKVSVFLPTINDAAGLGDGNATKRYQSEYHSSQERMFNKPRTFAEKISKQDDNEDSWQHAESEMHLPTPALNSNFTENLINHYKTSEGLGGIEKNSQVLGKKNNIGSSTFGEGRSRPIEKRGAFNISSPHYDILIIEHEKDHSSSRVDI